jgi:DNA polymerase III alpha subunit
VIQLKIRSEYSFGETFAPLDRLVARLKALGARGGGLVDRGTWGHVQWDYKMRAAGMVPLFGVEVGVVPSIEEKEIVPRMWLLARNSAGLQELYRLSSKAHAQAVRGAGLLTHQDVINADTALIAKFAGQVTDAELLVAAGAYIDFDPGSPLLNRRKAKIAREHRLRCVVVSDNYFPTLEDRTTFSVIGQQSKPTAQWLLEEPLLRAAVPELTSAEFDAAQALATELLEEAASVTLPKAKVIHVDGSLEQLCRAGIVERQLVEKGIWSAEYEQRLVYELDLIRSKEFESYFLVVADMVRYAKQHMLVGPSRGSAAGSLVCYLTRITEIDPIPPQLIFERFIDVTRTDLPDIDLDFVDSKRHLVIQYLRDKYGSQNVAHIGTTNTFQARSALLLVAKKLGIPLWEISGVKGALFERSSGDSRANFALMDTLEQTDPGRLLLAKFPSMKIAAELEAHASHAGVHAGGILVCNDAINNFCTVTKDGVAQIDKKDAEKLNLLKIDILGLRTLGVLEDTGVEKDWYGMTFDDPKVFATINKKLYAGIFQFEGQALQSVSSQMTIETLDDIGHITALARPGPMASGGTTLYLLRRSGKEKYAKQHELLEQYVKDTYGVVIYQEQVLNICKHIGDMSWADVTKLRQAMSKSYGNEYFAQFKEKFVEGAARVHGIDEQESSRIWEMVNTMGSWAFNLAHSYSYAVVSYWAAWLKTYHPLAFAAATLRNAMSDNSAIKVLREIVNEGYKYIPFDPDLSDASWSVKDGSLIGGFDGLKGIGASKAAKLVELRASNGGKLPDEKKAELAELEQSFADIFPTERRFGGYYREPEKFGVRQGSRVVRIAEITGEAEFVYVGRLVGKDLRDHNEAVRVRARGGSLKRGPTVFLDLDIEDDTGKILTRIDRYDFEELGRSIWDSGQLNSWWLIRAKRKLWGRPDSGFKMTYVTNIRELPDPFKKPEKQ